MTAMSLKIFAVALLCCVAACHAIPGGRSPVPFDDAKVTEAVEFAIAHLNSEQTGTYNLLEITSAERQVVAGLNFYLDLDLDNEGARESHSFVVYNKFGELKVTSHIGHNEEESLNMVGAPGPIEVEDEQVLVMAQFAVSELASKADLANAELDSVVSGTRQLVAGVNYKLVIKIRVGGESQLYKVTVWDKFGDLALTDSELLKQ